MKMAGCRGRPQTTGKSQNKISEIYSPISADREISTPSSKVTKCVNVQFQ